MTVLFGDQSETAPISGQSARLDLRLSQPSLHGAIGPSEGVEAAQLRHARNMERVRRGLQVGVEDQALPSLKQ